MAEYANDTPQMDNQNDERALLTITQKHVAALEHIMPQSSTACATQCLLAQIYTVDTRTSGCSPCSSATTSCSPSLPPCGS